MFLIPQRFRQDIAWLRNRLIGEPDAPEFAGEQQALCAVVAMGLLEHRQAEVFASCGSAPWLQAVASDDPNAKLAALAARFENRRADTPASGVVRLVRKGYPLLLPQGCDANLRAFARELGRSPEATLCAVLAIAVASMRSALAAADIGTEMARLAA